MNVCFNKPTVSERGFTIVELLITIVVIAILAAITIVTYNGIIDRTHDTAVQSDLRHIAQKLEATSAETGAVPMTGGLSGLGLSTTKSSYGEGHVSASDAYNLIYCRANDGSSFALVAWGRRGNGIAFIDGAVEDFGFGPAGNVTTCARAGYPAGTYSYLWLYDHSAWRSFVGGAA